MTLKSALICLSSRLSAPPDLPPLNPFSPLEMLSGWTLPLRQASCQARFLQKHTCINTYSIYAACKHEEMHGECGKHRAALSTRSFWKENRHIVRVKKKGDSFFCFYQHFSVSSGGRYSVRETIKKMGVVICCQSLLEYTQVNISSHTHWGLLLPMILLKQWSDALHDVKAWSRKRTLTRAYM